MTILSRYGLILFFSIFAYTLPAQAAISGGMTNEDLTNIINSSGLNVGIQTALQSGMSLSNILDTAIASGTSNSQVILVTLCVAGANNTDLREAAMGLNISPLIFASAMDTCSTSGEQDTQAYTPAQVVRTARGRSINPNPPPEPFASPSLF